MVSEPGVAAWSACSEDGRRVSVANPVGKRHFVVEVTRAGVTLWRGRAEDAVDRPEVLAVIDVHRLVHVVTALREALRL